MILTRLLLVLLASHAASGTVFFGFRRPSAVCDADDASLSDESDSVFSSDEEVINKFMNAWDRGNGKGAIAHCHPDFTFTSPRGNHDMHDAREAFSKPIPKERIIHQLERKGSKYTRDISFSPIAFLTLRIRQTFTLKRHNGRMKIFHLVHAKM